MAKITVSITTLQEKARLIHTLLAESQANHQQLWGHISTQVSMLPRDIAATHFNVNTPWNTALGTHYENYHQIADNMGDAAESYAKGEQNIKNAFEPFSSI